MAGVIENGRTRNPLTLWTVPVLVRVPGCGCLHIIRWSFGLFSTATEKTERLTDQRESDFSEKD